MSFTDAKRIVIKIGSSTLTHSNGTPNLRRIEQICEVVSDIKNSGREVVLVSSGAVAVGVNRLGLTSKPNDIPLKQAAAAIGQCSLMAIYDQHFSKYGYTAAQILLTRNVVEQEKQRQNTINTFNALLGTHAVPIVNENDTVLAEESLFGDNDRLSSVVASMIDADALVIFTDIDGLYDSDPKSNPEAKQILLVDEITPELMLAAGAAGTSRGTGGMRSKLEATEFAIKNGIDVAIMSGENPFRLYKLLDGEEIGTRFNAVI